jgi:two-component sensor histidine kinase
MLSSFTKWFIFVGLIISGMLLFITRMLVRAAAHDRDAFEWQFRQLQIRKTLNRELNHRVKNTLANVLSILALTKRRSATLDEFADSLAARIRALSATHGLLTQNEWSNADIRDIFEAELAPFLHSTGPVIAIAGPNIKLAPNIALSLGLAVHELATNAAKYGALTAATGRVDIVWRSIGDRKAEIIWSETGGPPVKPPDRRGFGLELLESIMSQEFSGAAKLEFLPTGLCCQLSVPVGPLPKAVTPLPI